MRRIKLRTLLVVVSVPLTIWGFVEGPSPPPPFARAAISMRTHPTEAKVEAVWSAMVTGYGVVLDDNESAREIVREAATRYAAHQLELEECVGASTLRELSSIATETDVELEASALAAVANRRWHAGEGTWEGRVRHFVSFENPGTWGRALRAIARS